MCVLFCLFSSIYSIFLFLGKGSIFLFLGKGKRIKGGGVKLREIKGNLGKFREMWEVKGRGIKGKRYYFR
jgi:hypothetical protein